MKFLLWILLIFLLVVRFYISRPIYKEGDRIRITSTVLSEPIKYETSQYFSLEGLKIYLDPYPEIFYGDRVVVEGTVDLTKKILKNPRLIKKEKSDNLLFSFRQSIISFYQKSLSEPHASLVAGMTLGSKSSIPEDFWRQLKNTGTAHVIVASGMNVSLVASFLMAILLLFIPRVKAVFLALVGIWLYAAVSGFEAPIIRAAIMGSIAFSAVAIGRLNFALRALFVSAYIMLLVNPDWIQDLGFILSFAATASLIVFEKRVRSLVSFAPSVIKEDLSTTLAAQVGVFPILYYTFGYYNILSPLINALILWTVPIITIVGMIAGFAGLIFEPLGKALLFLIYPLTSWFIFIIRTFGG